MRLRGATFKGPSLRHSVPLPVPSDSGSPSLIAQWQGATALPLPSLTPAGLRVPLRQPGSWGPCRAVPGCTLPSPFSLGTDPPLFRAAGPDARESCHTRKHTVPIIIRRACRPDASSGGSGLLAVFSLSFSCRLLSSLWASSSRCRRSRGTHATSRRRMLIRRCAWTRRKSTG